MEQNKSFNFLKKYLASADLIIAKDFKKASQSLQSSLEDYKQANQDENTNQLLSYEYSNVMYRTGWVHEQLSENEKALEYYKKVLVLNPRLEGLNARIEQMDSKLKNSIASATHLR